MERPKVTGGEGCCNCESRSIRGQALQHFKSLDWPFPFSSFDGHYLPECNLVMKDNFTQGNGLSFRK